ncbi:two-component sensor histidine kinase [Microbacterium radiodurans]|uniref:histidine kinase n=2 Tax=Microbacterium radiodurans TaxID=661398 RepID=A0A5J5ISS9_9MICO|nr:two-component sensor histidine kinase [Microbacterium radiodurans]
MWPVTGPLVVGLSVLGCAGLLLRRRFPVLVFAGGVVVVLASLFAPAPIGGPLLCFAAYAVAVYRSARVCLIVAAIAATLVLGAAVPLGVSGAIPSTIAWNAIVGETFGIVLGGLIGANVGNRKRYVAALIERSRQLVIERDQQALLAASGERERIARELHDIVAHSLTVMVALAEGVAASSDPERTRPGASAIAATGRGALRDMRATLGVLRDADAPPLTPLVRDTTAETVASARAAGYEATLTVAGDPAALGAATQLAVSRVVQEGVTNAMRHATGARRIDVSVAYGPDEVAVEVTDDGDPVDATTPGGYGLRGLRERVELAGGRVSAGRRHGRGWRVRAALPRRDEDRVRSEENE